MNFSFSERSANKEINYEALINQLENAGKKEIDGLLWQPARKPVSYLPVTYSKISKFRKPAYATGGLSVFEQFTGGRFTLVSFHVPWLNDDLKYSPLLLDRSTAKIIGIMMPFNELSRFFSEEEEAIIQGLTGQWINYIVAKKYLQ